MRAIAAFAACMMLAGAAWAADAPEIYNKKCKSCHSVGGVGGPMAKMGGALDGVGGKHDEAYFKAYLKDPKSQKADSKMPKVTLTDDETNAVVKYLLSLK